MIAPQDCTALKTIPSIPVFGALMFDSLYDWYCSMTRAAVAGAQAAEASMMEMEME